MNNILYRGCAPDVCLTGKCKTCPESHCNVETGTISGQCVSCDESITSKCFDDPESTEHCSFIDNIFGDSTCYTSSIIGNPIEIKRGCCNDDPALCASDDPEFLCSGDNCNKNKVAKPLECYDCNSQIDENCLETDELLTKIAYCETKTQCKVSIGKCFFWYKIFVIILIFPMQIMMVIQFVSVPWIL